MTPEQQQALAKARARLRLAGKKSPEMSRGLADMAVMTRDPATALDAERAKNRTVGQAIYDNVIGDPNDGVQSIGESIGTWINRAIETGTLGLVGDEAAAAAGSAVLGRDYDAELNRFRSNEKGMSTAGRLTADVAGAVAPALMGYGLASTAKTIPGMFAKGAAIGAGQGGTLGFMEGEGGMQRRLAEGASGAGLGAALGGIVGPLAGSATDKLAQFIKNNSAIKSMAKNAPTTDQLKAAGRSAYKAVDDAGVVVKPEAFADAAGAITGDMTNAGMRLGVGRSLAPKSADFAEVMADMATDPNYANGIPFSEIDTLRKVAGSPASDMGNRLESSLGTKAIEGIDDFVNRLTPDQIAAGNADNLSELIGSARSAWSKAMKSGLIDDAIESSRNYLSGEASGIRNQFARILKNPKLSRGFTDLEKAAMRKVINGSVPEQILNLFSGGLGQLGTMGVGAGVGGVPGFLLGAGISAGARKGAEALANRNAEVVRALIANGGAGNLPAISQTPRQVIEALIRRAERPIPQ